MPLSLAGKAVAAALALGSVGAYELAPADTRGQTAFWSGSRSASIMRG